MKRRKFHKILKKNSKKILFIISISFFILFDVTAKKLINYYNNSADYLIKNPIYHHDLRKNFNQENYFQFKKYTIITNSLGFKDSKIRNIKKNSSNWIITLVTYHNTKNKIIRKLFTKIKEKLILLNNSNLLPIINYLMTPGVIVSRNLILKVDYFQDKYGSSNDWSTWLDILKLEKPHILNKYNFSAGYNFNTISGSFNFEKY